MKDDIVNIPNDFDYHLSNSDDTFVDLIYGIPEFAKGRYEINKLGEVRLKDTKVILKVDDRTSKSGDGYPVVNVRGAKEPDGTYKRYSARIHILVALHFIKNPDISIYKHIDHLDRNTQNYYWRNLSWSTVSDNMKNRVFNKTVNKVYIKIDPKTNEVLEEIKYLNTNKIFRHCVMDSIRSKNKYLGFLWKIKDIDLENFYIKYGNPKEWKPILRFLNDGTNQKIYCSDNGLIKRVTSSGEEIITMGFLNSRGYRIFNHRDSKGIAHGYRVHRLVYETFSNKLLKDSDIIDHIDTDTNNNSYKNLKLCKSQSENLFNSITNEKMSKKVKQYDLEGNFIKEWKSISEALSFLGKNLNNSGITSCCKGTNRVSAFGYLWCYSREEGMIPEKVEKQRRSDGS